MKKILLFTLFLLYLQAFTQQSISGKVLDAQTSEALAFANVWVEKNHGTVSGYNGEFELKLTGNPSEFHVSYIGYQTQSVKIIPGKKYYTVRLQPVTENLGTVVIDGKYVNPAVVLMKKAIGLKHKNNYQKKLKQYAYTKYIRFVMAAETEKIPNSFDTIYKNGKVHKIDSTLYKFKQELSDKYMWIFENVMKVNVRNGNEKAEVIATRVAGLKKPLYEFLAMQVSGQNLYDDYYKFLFQSYVGPFSKLSFEQYKYEIDDTIKLQGRPVIVVDYKNTVKPLISGKIYLDSQSLAIAKLSLNTYKEFQFNAVYDFKYIPEADVWFPSFIDIKVKKAENEKGLNFGNVIRISESKRDTVINQKGDTLVQTRNQNELDYSYVHYSVHIQDVKVNEIYPVKIRYNMEVHPMAHRRDDIFWEKYAPVKNDIKAKNTYQYVDSIAEKEKIEQSLDKVKKLVKGYFPVHKYIDLDFLRVIDYNRYEKFRLQLGGKSSENFSDKWQLGAYVAYGFGDKEFKYSGSLRYKFFHSTQTYLKLSYTKDLNKSGSFTSFTERSLIMTEHHLADDKFYMQKAYAIDLSHLIIPTLKIDLNFTQGDAETKFDIPYHKGRLEFPDKDIAYAKARLEFTPFSKYILTPGGREVLKDGYPKFYLSFEKNFPDLCVDRTEYYRYEFQTWLKHTYLNKNYTELMIRTGFATKGTGIDKLFQPATNNFAASNPLKAFNLNKKFGFETMNDYEFISNFLITAHLRHNIQKIKTGKDKSIDLVLIGRMAYGLSFNNNRYVGIGSPDEKYFETGMEFHRIFGSMGLGFYYRLGAYAYDDPWQNLAVRLTLNPFNLSF